MKRIIAGLLAVLCIFGVSTITAFAEETLVNDNQNNTEIIENTEPDEPVSENTEPTDITEPTDSTLETNPTEPEITKYGWIQEDSFIKYYIDNTPFKGILKTKGQIFYFDDDGCLVTGWQVIDKKTYYFSNSGNLGEKGKALIGLKKINKKYYFFNDEGELVTGWKKNGSDIYYFSKSGNIETKGSAVTGLIKIEKRYYFFKNNGKLITGWKKIGSDIYYFRKVGRLGEKGSAVIGLSKIEKKYYFFKNNGKLITGWKIIGNDIHYFRKAGKLGEKGSALTGLSTVDNNKYYFKKNGKIVTGLKTVDGNKYFFNEQGAVGSKGKALKGWIEANKTFYYGYKNGKLATNTFVDGYQITKSGAMTKDSCTLKKKIRQFIKKHASKYEDKTQKLHACYNVFFSNQFTYNVNKAITPTTDDWRITRALDLLKTHNGACYNFGSTYCFVAKELGFNAKCIRGYVSANYYLHCWTEITIDGVQYISDPEANKYVKSRSLFLVTYSSKLPPWPYHKEWR